jgi:GH24 family phage-related lysozyme (muramidase)
MATEQAAENYTVEDLVALNPYNPDILNDLEKFVNEQVNPNHRDALVSAGFACGFFFRFRYSAFSCLRLNGGEIVG